MSGQYLFLFVFFPNCEENMKGLFLTVSNSNKTVFRHEILQEKSATAVSRLIINFKIIVKNSHLVLVRSVADPDPVGSAPFGRIRKRSF
jgi:hypothetical protein